MKKMNETCSLFSKDEIACAIHLDDFKSYLSPRPRDSHKHQFGHVLIIGGESGMTGAVQLASLSALRSGAGLVSVFLQEPAAGFSSEVMCHTRVDKLDALILSASVIAIGPGLGQSVWAKDLLKKVFLCAVPLVIDADALNLMSTMSLVPRENWILTPHPGEAARLLNTRCASIQEKRLEAAKKLQQKYGGTIILKGAGSIIATADNKFYRCTAGNPGMSTAGMGDALTGIVAAFCAQKLSLSLAALIGTCVHAAAGDRAAQYGERGLITSDLIEQLRCVVNPSHASQVNEY